MKKYKKILASIFVLLAGSLWGTMGIFVRTYTKEALSAIDIVGIRTIITSLILFLWLLVYKRGLLCIKVKDLWCFLGTGLGSIVFFNYCYFKCITLTSMSVAAVMLYTAPAIVIVLSYFIFKEQLTKVKLLALVMTLVGCVFVTGLIGSSEPLSGYGILVGLGAGFGYALYSVFSRCAIQRGYHSLTIMFYTFFFASLCVLSLIDIGHIERACFSKVSMMSFSIVFSLVSTVLPYGLYTYALNSIENGKASIIATIEPVVASLIGIIFYKEVITSSEYLGMFLIIGAITLCNLKFNK